MVRCFMDTDFKVIRAAIEEHTGFRAHISHGGKFLEDGRTPRDYNLFDREHLQIYGGPRGGARPKKQVSYREVPSSGEESESSEAGSGAEESRSGGESSAGGSDPESDSAAPGRRTATHGCGVPGCRKRHGGLMESSLKVHVANHLGQLVPDSTLSIVGLVRCPTCSEVGTKKAIEKHKPACPAPSSTPTRKADLLVLKKLCEVSRNQRGEGAGAEAADEDPVPADESLADGGEEVILEDFVEADLSKSGRDTPVTQCPRDLPLLQELVTNILKGLARAMRGDDRGAIKRLATALFDLPVLLADSEGRPARADAVHLTLNLNKYFS